MIAKAMPIALATFVAFGFSAGAQAAPRDETVSVTVQTADLNLRSEAGAKIALNRVRLAADQVCGSRPDPKLLGELAAYRACLKTTVDSAVASVDAPVLQALNSGMAPGGVLVATTR